MSIEIVDADFKILEAFRGNNEHILYVVEESPRKHLVMFGSGTAYNLWFPYLEYVVSFADAYTPISLTIRPSEIVMRQNPGDRAKTFPLTNIDPRNNKICCPSLKVPTLLGLSMTPHEQVAAGINEFWLNDFVFDEHWVMEHNDSWAKMVYAADSGTHRYGDVLKYWESLSYEEFCAIMFE